MRRAGGEFVADRVGMRAELSKRVSEIPCAGQPQAA
jgi:hypothetical protein